MMKRSRLYLYVLAVIMPFLISACVLDEPFDIPEDGLKGESIVSFDVDFRPMAPSLDTKTPGNAIKKVTSLSIVAYHDDGSFHSYDYLTSNDFREQVEMNNSLPGTAEAKYWRTKFDLKLPYGRYRIYAVANMGRLTEEQVKTEDALKSIKLNWNAASIADNNPMFGYFTDTEVSEIPSEAPVILISKATKTLHAWVKRAVSKITVSFDGSDLNEDVWISFKSVQIKDIPKSCILGKDNTPSSTADLIADGEKINFSQSEDISTWPYMAKGIPYPSCSSDHSETAEAMYFFENMQGVDNDDQYNKFQLDENDDGVVDGKDELKDLKPYGTYIEVKAYYVNKSDNASQGYITYRFMLGKNISNDFNAERNIHYKVKMKFKGDANNVDWHIDYVMDNPELAVATPLYISYLHRESLEIPVVVRGGTVKALKAEIVDNPWCYDGWFDENPAIVSAESDHDYNGFLSFVEPTSNNDVSWDWNKRIADYELGRAVNIDPNGGTFVDNANETRFRVPVWTRALLLGQGFTGNNIWVHKERIAQVKFTATIKDEDGNIKDVSQTVEVRQVKRLVNPTGIWRKNGSDKYFNINLMTGADEASFTSIISDGAWTARVIGGNDWVKIAKTREELDAAPLNNVVTGSTGSSVDFYYKPVDGNAPSTRCGVIEILYHGNTCIHYVFVSQGSTSVTMTDLGTKWHISNVLEQGQEEESPLGEGSMFRWLNTAAILKSNNFRPEMGLYQAVETYLSTTGTYSFYNRDEGADQLSAWPLTNDDSNGDGAYESEYRLRINAQTNWNNIMNGNGKPASVEQWAALEDLPRFYGVLYGDDSYAPKPTTADAYQFTEVGQDKGMRGMFVWDRITTGKGSGNGNHIFFPIGSTGHGHRKHYDDKGSSLYKNIAVLRYATTHQPLNPTATINSVPNFNSRRAPLYNLYLSPGAIYWTNEWGTADNASKSNAYDINYETYDFNEFSTNAMYSGIRGPKQPFATFRDLNGNGEQDTGETSYGFQSSDACFIRCVD